MIDKLIRALVRFAQRSPYEHLYHADGTVYMERWHLLQRHWWTFGWRARIHHIATPDLDRHLHDHPWLFVSIVLKGWYVEERPLERDPCFEGDYERCYLTQRKPGSIALRRPTDRHRICHISQGGVWTIFITGPARQWWGFFTPFGKMFWRDYPSCHAAGQV